MTKKAMICLVLTHVVAGLLMLGWCLLTSIHSMRGLGLITLGFSQGSLLGSWTGLSSLKPWLRALGFILANIGLSIELIFLVRYETELIGVLWGIAIISYLSCLAYRRTLGTLIQRERSTLQRMTHKWQFSIRQLMILTLIVSFGLTGRIWFRSAFTITSSGPHEILYFVLAIFMAILGVGCVWGMLSPGLPAFRCIASLVFAVFLVDLFNMMLPNGRVKVAMILLISEALILLVPLFVVRVCGYRLVRKH